MGLISYIKLFDFQIQWETEEERRVKIWSEILKRAKDFLLLNFLYFLIVNNRNILSLSFLQLKNKNKVTSARQCLKPKVLFLESRYDRAAY